MGTLGLGFLRDLGLRISDAIKTGRISNHLAPSQRSELAHRDFENTL